MDTQNPRTEMVFRNVIGDAKEIQKDNPYTDDFLQQQNCNSSLVTAYRSFWKSKASTQLTDRSNTCVVGCHNVDLIPTQALEIFLPWPSILKCFNK